MNPAIDRSIQLMNENLSDHIGIRELAAKVGMGRWYFHRVFTAATGQTPGRYLAALRMAEACRILVETDCPIADIGPAVGYQSIGNFGTRFKQHTGVAPGEYRKRGRTDGQG